MRTVSRRGEFRSVRSDGWHTGDGKRTWCDKTRDEWDLALRTPSGKARRCEACEERKIHLLEQLQRRRSAGEGTVLIPDPLFCRGILVDAGIAASEFLGMARRAPTVFDIRRAGSRLVPPLDDTLDPFCDQYRGAEQMAGTRRSIDRWCGLNFVISPWLTSDRPWLVKTEQQAIEWIRPLMVRARRRTTLRARWDREVKQRRTSSEGS